MAVYNKLTDDTHIIGFPYSSVLSGLNNSIDTFDDLNEFLSTNFSIEESTENLIMHLEKLGVIVVVPS
ncbi:hypothetical protein [Catenovulum maritimum]|nr:hypothetical protein [Catenovulum maritimum]